MRKDGVDEEMWQGKKNAMQVVVLKDRTAELYVSQKVYVGRQST